MTKKSASTTARKKQPKKSSRKRTAKTTRQTALKKAAKKMTGTKSAKTAIEPTKHRPARRAEADVAVDTAKSNGQACDEVSFDVGPENGKGTRQVTARYADKRYDDNLNVMIAKNRDELFDSLAGHFTIPRVELDQYHGVLVDQAEEADDIVEWAAANNKPAEAEHDAVAVNPGRDSEALLAATPQDVREAAEQFLRNPRMYVKLESDLKRLGIAREKKLALTIYLVATSRKLSEPLAACVKAPSASGKSMIVNTVVNLIPPEDVLEATDITPNALYYLPPGSLKQKLVSVAEAKHVDTKNSADVANAGVALRVMISNRKLSKLVTIRTDGGQFTARPVEQEGPIAYIEASTAETFEENANRMLALSTDESPQQTRAIMPGGAGIRIVGILSRTPGIHSRRPSDRTAHVTAAQCPRTVREAPRVVPA